MRKLKEVLRLRYELKLGLQPIARSCAIAESTVHKYLKRAEGAGLSCPLPEGWDEAKVEGRLFPRPESNASSKKAARALPDFAAIHEHLRSHNHVTLQLLWEESGGASYSWLNSGKLHRKFSRRISKNY
jgi:transposase